MALELKFTGELITAWMVPEDELENEKA